MPVPRGFAITIRAGSFFLLRTPGLFKSLFSLLKCIDPEKPALIADISQQVENLVLAAPIPAEVERALSAEWDAAFGKDADVVVALRSSAIAEDGVQSFAGQYRSILGVTRQDMAVNLHRAENIFVFPAAAQCRLKSVTLESEALPADLLQAVASPQPQTSAAKGAQPAAATGDGHGQHDGHEQGAEHADLDASFAFECAHPEALHGMRSRFLVPLARM